VAIQSDKAHGSECQASDGTISFAADFNSMGERFTLNAILDNNKPYMDIDINNPLSTTIVVATWIRKNNIKKLNIAWNTKSHFH